MSWYSLDILGSIVHSEEDFALAEKKIIQFSEEVRVNNEVDETAFRVAFKTCNVREVGNAKVYLLKVLLI